MTIISNIITDNITENSVRVKCRTDQRTKITLYVTDNPNLAIENWDTIVDYYARRSHYLSMDGLMKGTVYSFMVMCEDCNYNKVDEFTTLGTSGPDPEPDPQPQEFLMDNHYFDGSGGQYGLWEDTDKLDINGPMTWMIWFRRDIFNLQQFFLSKGHWGDQLGWRMMVKQTEPPYQYEQIQFDVGDGTDLNYYKSNKGVTDSRDHFAAMVFNPNIDYIDSKNVTTHGFVCLDGDCDDYYMARSDTNKPPITRVKPYRAPMYLGRHFCDGKFYFAGMIYDAKIIQGDIGKNGVTTYYNDTKDMYNKQE